MLLNLSYNIENIFNCILDNNLDKSHECIDFTGVLTNSELTNIKFARDLDKDSIIEKEALKNYINFIGSLSSAKLKNRKIDSFRLMNNIPALWFSPIAEKHDSYHWGQRVFFMILMLKEYKTLLDNDEKIYIILSDNTLYCKSLISNILKNNDIINYKFYTQRNNNNSKGRIIKNLLIGILKYIKLYKNYRRKTYYKSDLQTFQNIFICRDISGKDLDIDDYQKLLEKNGNSYLIPYFNNLEDYINLGFSSLHPNFKSAFPGIKDFLKIIFSIINFLRMLVFINKSKLINIDGYKFNQEILYIEFLKSIDIVSLFNYCWFKNFFTHLDKKTKIFFTDEFYISGRFISQSIRDANNELLISYGIQHGILTDNHTVYQFSKQEIQLIKTENGFSIPDNFLVWGDYYKNRFQKWNPKINIIVVSVGHLKHQYLREHINKCIKTDITSILWCTTLEYYFKFEYYLIKNFLESHNNYNIIIRMHPCHNIKEIIYGTLEEKFLNRCVISENKNIVEDFNRADIIFTSAISSIYLDGIIAGIPVVRGISKIISADKIDINSIYDVANPSEFDDAINNIIKVNSMISKKDSDYLSKFNVFECWKELVAN